MWVSGFEWVGSVDQFAAERRGLVRFKWVGSVGQFAVRFGLVGFEWVQSVDHFVVRCWLMVLSGSRV